MNNGADSDDDIGISGLSSSRYAKHDSVVIHEPLIPLRSSEAAIKVEGLGTPQHLHSTVAKRGRSAEDG